MYDPVKCHTRWSAVIDAAVAAYPAYHLTHPKLKPVTLADQIRTALRHARTLKPLPEDLIVAAREDYVFIGARQKHVSPAAERPPVAIETDHTNEAVLYSLITLLDYGLIKGPVRINGNVAQHCQQLVARVLADVAVIAESDAVILE